MSKSHGKWLQFTKLKNDIEENWLRLENTPDVFRYKLNIRKSKLLKGSYNFVVQFNSDRITNRRAPQKISSINQAFDETKFNFNKVKPNEILCTFRDVTFLINTSPVTKYHIIMCPSMKHNLPQILTAGAIRFAFDLLVNFRESSYRIGYNSLGALASVNHLHMHLFRIQDALWINKKGVKHLTGDVFTNTEPVKYYSVNCHFFKIVHKTVDAIYKIVNYLNEQNIPYNIMFTYHERGCCEVVTAFIFPRSQISSIKNYSNLNIACCELGGFFNVGTDEMYDSLTEEIITNKIESEIGEIPNLDNEIKELFENSDDQVPPVKRSK